MLGEISIAYNDLIFIFKTHQNHVVTQEWKVPTRELSPIRHLSTEQVSTAITYSKRNHFETSTGCAGKMGGSIIYEVKNDISYSAPKHDKT